MRGRTRARQIALKCCFQVDLVQADINETLEYFEQEENPSRAVLGFSRQLIQGVADHRDEIDSLIKKQLENWDFTRLGNVERTILRLAVFELLYRPDVPSRVAINEAIELGKEFTTRQSVRFINGVLDGISSALPPRSTGQSSPSSSGTSETGQ